MTLYRGEIRCNAYVFTTIDTDEDIVRSWAARMVSALAIVDPPNMRGLYTMQFCMTKEEGIQP